MPCSRHVEDLLDPVEDPTSARNPSVALEHIAEATRRSLDESRSPKLQYTQPLLRLDRAAETTDKVFYAHMLTELNRRECSRVVR